MQGALTRQPQGMGKARGRKGASLAYLSVHIENLFLLFFTYVGFMINVISALL